MLHPEPHGTNPAKRWSVRQATPTARELALLTLLGVILAACSGPVRLERTALVSEARASSATSRPDEAKARVVEDAKHSLSVSGATRCPEGMSDIEGRYCIDRWEASLLEILPNGEERAHSPYHPVDGVRVRAVSRPGVAPQGYVSAVEAGRACGASGKRLCRLGEWRKACRGPESKTFGYGASRERGRCNDDGRSPVILMFGRRWNNQTMNQPGLNQLEHTLAPTGSHEGCTNGYGVYDMVGNLHEWVADHRGSFHGGFYQDVTSHGMGCDYVTTAHEARYHDYSTGFRCCADMPGDAPSSVKAAPKKAAPRKAAPRKTQKRRAPRKGR